MDFNLNLDTANFDEDVQGDPLSTLKKRPSSVANTMLNSSTAFRQSIADQAAELEARMAAGGKNAAAKDFGAATATAKDDSGDMVGSIIKMVLLGG